MNERYLVCDDETIGTIELCGFGGWLIWAHRDTAALGAGFGHVQKRTSCAF